MAIKADGVADGWLLFEGWCKRNGGTPIRGSSSADHVCFVGPLPEDTIDPGDEGTVDVTTPDDVISGITRERLELELQVAELEFKQAEFNYKVATSQITSLLTHK